MNRTLRLTGLACLGAWLLAPEILAQPVLTGPATNRPDPVGEEPDRPSTRYVLKKNGIEGDAPTGARVDEAASASKAAVDGRHLALEQFRQGNDALRRGYTDAAASLFEPLKLNPYLTPQERKQLVRICEQMYQKEVRRVEAMTHMNRAAAPRLDPDALLADGRRAFEMRNYDQAEALARQAQVAGHTSMLPWSDTPTKLLKDVQSARNREMVVARPEPRRSPTPLPQAQAQLPPRTLVDPLMPPGTTPGTASGTTPTFARNDNEPRDPRAASARRLLEQAYFAARNGDVSRARQLLQDVETLKLAYSPAEPFTPEKVRLEITRVELAAKAKPTDAGSGVQQAVLRAGSPAKPVDSGMPASPSARPTELPAKPPAHDAKNLVTEARRHYQAGRFDQAVALAKQAQLTSAAKWGHFEDSPEKIIHDVTKVRQEQNEKKAGELLMDARKLLNQGRCDDAEKLTYQAEALRSEYPVWYSGEKHDRLRQEIGERRRALAKPTLPPLLDPVPLPAVAGNPPAASGTKPLLEPRKPASDIIASSPTRPAADNSPKPDMASTPSSTPKAPATRDPQALSKPAYEPKPAGRPEAPSAGVGTSLPPGLLTPLEGPSATGARTPAGTARPAAPEIGGGRKASQFLAEARQKQQEGLLLAARALHDQAKSCHATQGLEDDVTDEQLALVLSELRKDAGVQVQEFGAAVQTLTARGSYKDAERYLQYMQQLTATYQITDQTAPTGRPTLGVVQTSGQTSRPPPRLAEEHSQEPVRTLGPSPVNVTVIINANGETPVLLNDPGRRATIVQPQK